MTTVQQLPALGVALVCLASCGGSGTSSSEVPGRPSVTKSSALKPLVVHIRNFAYLPAAPVVVVGQPIEIVNDDTDAHTWSAAPGAGWTYTSGNLEPGKPVTFPGFINPGSYKFLCYYHAEMPSMNGVVTVKTAP